MNYRTYTSKDQYVYQQSISLRNNDLYGSVGMPDLSKENQKIEKDNLFFGAFDGNQLIGTCSVYNIDPQHFRMVAVCVAQAYQGQGVGTKLIRYALECLKERMNRNFIITLTGRKEAYSFYERLGFIKAGKEETDPEHNYVPHTLFQMNVTM